MSSEQFDFGAAVQGEAWHPAQQEIAPKGNYIFTIVDVENTRTKSKNAYPMIKLRLECEAGVQWDNLVISPNEFSFGKVLGLIDSAGLPRPVPGKDLDPEDGKLTDAYVEKLFGKRVGGIVRDETEIDNRPDSVTFGQETTRPRMKGYVAVDKIKAASPSGNGGTPNLNAASVQADDDIPF